MCLAHPKTPGARLRCSSLAEQFLGLMEAASTLSQQPSTALLAIADYYTSVGGCATDPACVPAASSTRACCSAARWPLLRPPRVAPALLSSAPAGHWRRLGGVWAPALPAHVPARTSHKP